MFQSQEITSVLSFICKVSVGTDNKHLRSYLKRFHNLVTRVTLDLLYIHQYRMILLYMPGLQICMADLRSRQIHSERKYVGITSEHHAIETCADPPRMHDSRRP